MKLVNHARLTFSSVTFDTLFKIIEPGSDLEDTVGYKVCCGRDYFVATSGNFGLYSVGCGAEVEIVELVDLRINDVANGVLLEILEPCNLPKGTIGYKTATVGDTSRFSAVTGKLDNYYIVENIRVRALDKGTLTLEIVQ